MSKLELRFLSNDVTTDENSRIIRGYALKFGKLSQDLGGYKELIKTGALDNFMKKDFDVIANINHDNNLILARSKKNLNLSIDNIGLKFELTVPNTTYGNDLLVNIRANNIEKCSFAMVVNRDRWVKNKALDNVRIIEDIKEVHDISIVTVPAYEDTSVTIRNKMPFAKNNLISDVEYQKRLKEFKKYV